MLIVVLFTTTFNRQPWNPQMSLTVPLLLSSQACTTPGLINRPSSTSHPLASTQLDDCARQAEWKKFFR
jgi:hypothetical protein